MSINDLLNNELNLIEDLSSEAQDFNDFIDLDSKEISSLSEESSFSEGFTKGLMIRSISTIRGILLDYPDDGIDIEEELSSAADFDDLERIKDSITSILEDLGMSNVDVGITTFDFEVFNLSITGDFWGRPVEIIDEIEPS